MTLSNFRRIVGNRFFTVEFIKRSTGETRRMTARLGVTKYLRGNAGHKKPEGIVTVWACDAQNYRSFHLSSMTDLRANGKIYRGAR